MANVSNLVKTIQAGNDRRSGVEIFRFFPANPSFKVGDTVVIGPAMLVGVRVNKANPKADVMAFDVRVTPAHDANGTITGVYNYDDNAKAFGKMSLEERIAMARRGFSTAVLLLAGVAVNLFFGSLILLIQYLSDFTSSFIWE